MSDRRATTREMVRNERFSNGRRRVNSAGEALNTEHTATIDFLYLYCKCLLYSVHRGQGVKELLNISGVFSEKLEINQKSQILSAPENIIFCPQNLFIFISVETYFCLSTFFISLIVLGYIDNRVNSKHNNINI